MLENKEKTREQIIEKKVNMAEGYLRKFYESPVEDIPPHYLNEMCDGLELELINIKGNKTDGYVITIQTSYDDYCFKIFYKQFSSFYSMFFSDEEGNEILYEKTFKR